MQFQIKYNEFERAIELPASTSFGTLQEKILATCNLIIYDIECLRIIFDDKEIIIGSDDAPFNHPIESCDLENMKYILVSPKNDNKDYINKYINYMRTCDDENIAKQLQEEDEINPMHILSLMSHFIQNITPQQTSTSETTNAQETTQISSSQENTAQEEEESEDTEEEEHPNYEIQITLNPPLGPTTSDNFNSVFNHMGHQMMNAMVQNFLSGGIQIMNPPEDVKIVSSKEDINKMENIIFEKFKTNELCKNTQCNICLEEYEDSDYLILFKCNHYFHKDCIIKWLEDNSNKCPICREEVSKGKPINI